ncbi:DUF2267 domain-containing protein [Methylohalobius crimeensis]|uniref:DUF2267 domain-containing protein n=1 Tax=Methylohalobius crimeensis TaxID=244365 RepID=UPI0003B628E6|nr:DUF2267 domain-containing protein [Methylohalobius crimeensis]
MTTPDTHIRTFDSTLQTTHRWLQELKLVASLENESQAYAVLRVVLHALRDRLPADEAVQLGAELPMLIRGFYYEGWKPSATPKKQRSLDAFLEGLQPMPRLKGELSAEEAVRSVFMMLDHRISEGEIADVRHALPAEVRDLWPKH